MKPGIYINIHKNGYTRFGENRYKKIYEHGFRYVDLNMADTDTPFYTSSLDEVEAVLIRERELAAEAGVGISQVHGPWRWPVRDFTPEDQSERAEKMKRSIVMTAMLGCKNWVIHPIMPYGLEDAGTPYESKTKEFNLKFMRDLLTVAKKCDVTICLENMPFPRLSISSPEQILEFVKEINDEHFKICLDTGHSTVFYNSAVADAVRTLGNYIRVLHVHDDRIGGHDLHLPPRYGIIDWEDFSKALHEIGFSGSFSLETAPPAAYPAEIFEQLCTSYAKIAEDIIG